MSQGTWRVSAPSAADATEFGRRLAAVLRAGDLVLLHGELGAGKTTLARGIGEGLGVRGPVSSPTFIIARTHRPARPGAPGLVHVDAYRLSDAADLESLDLDSSLATSVTVVEWGEGLAEVLSADRLEITIERERGGDSLIDDGARHLTLRTFGARWRDTDFGVVAP